jgi:hypothetical protein
MELVQSLAKVVFLLKHSVKLRRCILHGDVAARHETAWMLFVVQTDIAIVLYFGIATCFGHFRLSSGYQNDKMGKNFNVIYYAKIGSVYKVTCFLRHCNLSQIITVDYEFPS